MEKSNALVKTFPVVWIVIIVVCGILVLFQEYIYAISFALGNFTSLMTMSMLVKSSHGLVNVKEKHEAQKMVWKNYAIRYLIYIVILVTAQVHPNLNLLVTAAGLFVFKICLYGVIYFTEKGDKE